MAARVTGIPDGGNVPWSNIEERIVFQRAQRYTDTGPDLRPLGSARFRHEGGRLFVAFAQIPPAQLGASIDRVAAYARSRGMRVQWTLTRTLASVDSPSAHALMAHGFALDERLILMARQGTLDVPRSRQVSIAPIGAFAEMKAYENGSRRSFYGDRIPDDAMVIARASERWRQQEMGWFRYYIARIGDTEVGGLYVSLWEDVPTLMGVYTIETARSQGVATTAIQHAVSELVASGRDSYCLYVKDGNPAERLYNNLGFRKLHVEETYFLDN
ncbi:MAG TPA: GNAT family N-acetyltransferase [Ktedonobacterales bacterium]